MKLITSAVFVAGLVPLSYQLQINTPPSMTQCEPVMFSWNGGSPPYYLSLVPAGQPSGQPLKQFPATNDTSMTWKVDMPAGTSCSVALTDGTGENAYSSIETIQNGPDSSCLNSSVSESGGQPGPTAASSMGATSTAANIAAAATTSGGSTSGGSTSGGSTSGSSASRTSSATSSAANAAKTSNAASRGPSMGTFGAVVVVGVMGAVLL